MLTARDPTGSRILARVVTRGVEAEGVSDRQAKLAKALKVPVAELVE